MAMPETIKEVTVTKVSIATGAYGAIALAADPDRILLGIHAYDGTPVWYHAINSTAPVSTDTMIKHDGNTESVFFTTHVPTETVYIYQASGGAVDFFIEHASR
jgi:hypothetical protein